MGEIGFAWSDDREWLVGNGLGGYASSTVTGLNTRRYHGLLVSAFSPEDRRVLLSKIDEELAIGSEPGRQIYKLSTTQYHDTIEPLGCHYQKRFSLNPHPKFVYEISNARIEKTVFMPRGMNAVVICYDIRCKDDAKEASFAANFITTSRDSNWLLKGPAWKFRFTKSGGMASLTPTHKKPSVICIGATAGEFSRPQLGDNMLHNVFYRKESERGYDSSEDLFIGARLEAKITGHQRFYVVCSSAFKRSNAEKTCKKILAAPQEFECQDAKRKARLLAAFCRRKHLRPTRAVAGLVYSSDDFIIQKGTHNAIIAGYPWFGEWGRDSLISLPGLCLATGRKKEAESIMLNLIGKSKLGVIPNNFTGKPNYNSLDTSLWLFWAVWKYLEYTKDYDFVKKHLWSEMKKIIAVYSRMCDRDGLLLAKSDKPMTWMDAIIDGTPATLRSGKAVEMQALWHNALMVIAKLAPRFKEHGVTYQKASKLCKASFNRKFWNPQKSYLFDVIDEKDAVVRINEKDDALRPNALFSISMPFAVLDKAHWQAVVDTASQELLTPYGLRTLGKSEPNYRGYFGANQNDRDWAYHNGDVWPWLLGAFTDAHSRAYPHKKFSHLLAPILEYSEKGPSVRTVTEVFAGDPPHKPEGCISQAWSVGEMLRIIAENPIEL